MAENCSILEPWSVMSGVGAGGGGGHWAPDVFSRESDAVMRALQASFSDPKGPDILAHESDVIAAALQASLYQPVVSTTTTTNNSNSYYNHQHQHQDLSSYLSSPSSMDLYSSPSSQLLPSPTTPSSAPLFSKPELVPAVALPAPVSDSDSPPTAAKKPRPGGVSTGRVSKRRPSRASKRSPTTFISADPANFRQMVQEVTGVQIPTMSGSGSCHQLSSPLLSRPEPQRLSTAPQQGRFFAVRGGSCVPTLDTSAFVLDQTVFVDLPSVPGAPSSSTSSPGSHPAAPPAAAVTTTTTTTTSVSFSSGGLDMGLPCFPTLESSWEVM